MMSHEDRRRIAAIERQLWVEDPKFARRFSDRCVAWRRPWRRPGTRALALGIGYLLSVVAGLLAQSWVVFLLCAALTGGAGWGYDRIRRHRAGG